MRMFIPVSYTTPSLIIWASNKNSTTEAGTPTANRVRLMHLVVSTDWLLWLSITFLCTPYT